MRPYFPLVLLFSLPLPSSLCACPPPSRPLHSLSQLSSALLFDAAYAVVTAVQELNRSQEIGVKPLSCGSAQIWQHGTSLMNYLRMVRSGWGPAGPRPACGWGPSSLGSLSPGLLDKTATCGDPTQCTGGRICPLIPKTPQGGHGLVLCVLLAVPFWWDGRGSPAHKEDLSGQRSRCRVAWSWHVETGCPRF